jgi:hypothetical protein
MFAWYLGWTFDGHETFSLILVVCVALRELLDPSQFAQIPAYAARRRRPRRSAIGSDSRILFLSAALFPF